MAIYNIIQTTWKNIFSGRGKATIYNEGSHVEAAGVIQGCGFWIIDCNYLAQEEDLEALELAKSGG